MADGRHRQRLHVAEQPQPAAGAEVAPGIDSRLPQIHGASGVGAAVMHRVAGQRVDAIHSRHTGQRSGGQHRTHRNGPAPVLSQVCPHSPIDGTARLRDHTLASVDSNGLTNQTCRRRPGPGLDTLDAQGDQEAQGWCRVMAYIGPLAEASGTLRKVHSRETVTTGPTPALTSVMTPAATTALMMGWRSSPVRRCGTGS